MGKSTNESREIQKILEKVEKTSISAIPTSLNLTEYYDKRRDITHEKVLKSFLLAKKLEGCSASTINAYRCTIDYFLKTVNKKITKISTLDIRNFMIEYQNTRKCKNVTMDGMRRVLSTFFNYLEDEDIILKSPVRKIRHIKYEKTINKPFTEEEIEKIRDACDSIRNLALVEFLNSSGVRVSELCDLDIEDLDFSSNEGIVFGKGSKERIVYFDSKTKLHLRAYLNRRTDDLPALFISEKPPYRRLTRSGVEFIIRVIGEIAGVEKCHPHRFRRTLATRLIDRGVPIEQVQRILGHTKLDTTLIYAQVNQSNVKLNHSKFCS